MAAWFCHSSHPTAWESGSLAPARHCRHGSHPGIETALLKILPEPFCSWNWPKEEISAVMTIPRFARLLRDPTPPTTNPLTRLLMVESILSAIPRMGFTVLDSTISFTTDTWRRSKSLTPLAREL